MIHYYTNNKDLKSNKKKIKINFEKEVLEIYTDLGVFSKDGLDLGTKLLLEEFLKDNKKDGLEILDIGCGYGIVSLILSKYLKKSKFTLTDVNDRALLLAEENLKEHKVDIYKLINSNAFENISGSFDIILSNPPIRAGKDTIFNIYEGAEKQLNKDGKFYCVIKTKHGAKSTFKKLKDIFGNCKILNIVSGYRIYVCKKEKNENINT